LYFINGRELYLVQNYNIQMTVVGFRHCFGLGRIVDAITGTRFDFPTTLVRSRSWLYVINSRLSTPPTPDMQYSILQISKVNEYCWRKVAADSRHSRATNFQGACSTYLHTHRDSQLSTIVGGAIDYPLPSRGLIAMKRWWRKSSVQFNWWRTPTTTYIRFVRAVFAAVEKVHSAK
jgi:hypothetical protein